MSTTRCAGIALVFGLFCCAATQAAPTGGFLDDNDIRIQAWTPPTPVADSAVEASDIAIYLETRRLVAGPRGDEAHLDDVYVPTDVAHRFSQALGVTLTPANAKVLLDTIQLAQVDLEAVVKPIKLSVKAGGRIRPFVQFPTLAACDHEVDDSRFQLNESGSYPSTHAALGMLWALILSQLAPDRTDALFAKGYQFGESRLVCGFHYPSDLTAGRLAATVLFAKLETTQAFVDQMTAAKAELDATRGLGPVKTTPLIARVKKDEEKRILPTLAPMQ